MIAKLSRLDGPDWVPHRYSGTFRIETIRELTRLVVAPAGNAVSLLCALADRLSSPVLVLWVLHTSRVGSELGRYQSPPLPLSAAKQLMETHAEFLENDARSDIWLHSREPESTIVFERHGLIYAYGELQAFRDVLESAGLREGVEAIPSPHAHHYHELYDSAETALASQCEWTITPLHPEDEQVKA
jgi:hypothetical protein